MSTLQTFLSLALLIYVLSVIVQAIQELVKAALATKATVMEQTVTRFMGNYLPLQQVRDALGVRGLNIADLENFNPEAFRHLLDGIPFWETQLRGVVASAGATVDQAKDSIAASYEAVRAAFQRAYTRKNKLFVLGISFLVVILLNANLIVLYQKISADQVAQQAIVGQAALLSAGQQAKTGAPPADLGAAYANSRNEIYKALQSKPILLRTLDYPQDFADHPFVEILGLLFMGILVSLGAPFWNDILKGLMGANNALNANGGRRSA